MHDIESIYVGVKWIQRFGNPISDLLYVLLDAFGNFEHAERLCTNDLFQLLVSVNRATFLELVSTDVLPNLLGDLGAGRGGPAHELGEFSSDLDRLEQSLGRAGAGAGAGAGSS